MKNFFAAMINRLPIGRRVLEAYLIALILILVAFPDVIFNGASFRLTDQITGASTGVAIKPFYPIPNSTGWWAGYNDNGGAIFQSEPMIEFMARSIKNGETPYWNPYSAAGSLGPEALVDQKFSAFTLANAILGGGSLIYNLIILTLSYFAVFFTYRIVRELLGFTALSASGASVFYLLNGYVTANFGSNVTQVYFFVPVCLYAALSFVDRRSVLSWSAVVLAFGLFFSCTFMPTTITSLLGIAVVVTGFLLNGIHSKQITVKQGGVLVVLLAVALFASVLLLAPLYFPLLENLSSLGTLDDYSKRIFWPLRFPYAIPSFFSPTHLFESYNAMELPAIMWDVDGSVTGNTVFHCGVIAIGLAGCAWTKRADSFRWLAGLCAISVAFVVIRLFNPLWIQLTVGSLPVVGSIGSQYWWPIIMLSMTLLVGFGINNLERMQSRLLPALILLAVGGAGFGYVFQHYGLHEPNVDFKRNFLLFSLSLTILLLCLFVVVKAGLGQKFSNFFIITAITVMFVELLVSGKMIRYERNDLFASPPASVAFVRANAGLYRTLNFGQTGLYPELGSAFGVQEITALNQGVLPAYKDYFYAAINLENSQRLGYHPTVPLGSFPTLLHIKDNPSSNIFNWDAISFLGVKYILVPADYPAYRSELKVLGFDEVYVSPNTAVFENKKVLPRAFTIDMAGISESDGITLEAAALRTLAPASIDVYRNGRVFISGSVDRESLFVLSDSWHSNWSALLNGKKVSIVKVNGAFRGIVVPQGRYIVEMNYQPKSLNLALAVSFFVLLFVFLIFLWRKRLESSMQRRFDA